MTLQSILNTLPLNDHVTISVWDTHDEEELIRVTKLVGPQNTIHIFGDEVLTHRLARVRYIYTNGDPMQGIIIECKANPNKTHQKGKHHETSL